MQRRPIPVDQQFDLDLQCGPVVVLQNVTSTAQGQVLRGVGALEFDEGVDRRPPKRVLRRSARHLGAEHPIAEILDEQQAVLEILAQNLGALRPAARSGPAMAAKARTMSSARCAIWL